MKKLLLAGVALVSLVTAASAADLAARPYTKAPALAAPGYNWSGFYAGVMGGYAWASDGNGGFGGGTIGYNWQAPGSQFVFGLEADAAGSDLKATQSQFVPGVGLVTAQDKVDAFGSVTGRAGFAVDATLFYVKGGYAWADNKLSATVPGIITFSDSHVHSGYTVGAGLEYMFAPNWSGKIEYMYANLSSENYSFAPGVTFASGNFDFNTIKAGINYHFK
jgi:outer membrane immunogenic protein